MKDVTASQRAIKRMMLQLKQLQNKYDEANGSDEPLSVKNDIRNQMKIIEQQIKSAEISIPGGVVFNIFS